jgi:heterodisulfide reductase subunit A-like polyferredoxin
MFPSSDCSACTILPRMPELASNPDNIKILAFSEVKGIE